MTDFDPATDLPFLVASGAPQRTPGELLSAIRRRVPDVVTRFAPAPTGDLHLGHIVNAVYVWGLARALDGRVILRIEDHDRQRSRRVAEQRMLDDLAWLGLEADIYPSTCYRAPACDGRQSERDEVYRRALTPLIDAGWIYGCRCTRAAQAVAMAAPAGGENVERAYPGTCRAAGIPLTDDVGWRLRIDPGAESFDDLRLGPQSQDPSVQCGDLLLRDRLGNWTYQCAASIDDAVQGVTLVVRGEDLLASTGRQIRLARLVGRDRPAAFLHHALILKSATQKLSKSDGDSGIAALRAAGWRPEDVLARAASLAGLAASADPIRSSALAAWFPA